MTPLETLADLRETSSERHIGVGTGRWWATARAVDALPGEYGIFDRKTRSQFYYHASHPRRPDSER